MSRCATEANAKTITFTLALIPIIWVLLVVAGKSATSIFVTETHIAIELDFSNRRRELPFSRCCTSRLFHQFGAHFLGFLVSDEPLFDHQIEQSPCILRPGNSSAQRNAESGCCQC